MKHFNTFYSFSSFYLSKVLIFLLVGFFSLSITAEVSNKDQAIVRYHIKNGEYQDAKNRIEQLSIVNFNDPQLELFATEILILEAENAYNKKLYKTSYEKFLKANEKWSTHPLVRDRLAEMKHKILKDNKEIVKTRYTPLSKTEGKEDNSYQWSLYNQELFDLKISLQNQEKKYWNLLFLFSCSTLMMLFLLFITVKTNRKEN